MAAETTGIFSSSLRLSALQGDVARQERSGREEEDIVEGQRFWITRMLMLAK